MAHVILPGGAWAELADPAEVPERKRRPYVSAMTAVTSSTAGLPRDEKGDPDTRFFGPEQQAAYDAAEDALILALVVAWSFPQPPSAAALLDLNTRAYDELRKACNDLAAGLMPGFEPSPDPLVRSDGSIPSPTG